MEYTIEQALLDLIKWQIIEEKSFQSEDGKDLITKYSIVNEFNAICFIKLGNAKNYFNHIMISDINIQNNKTTILSYFSKNSIQYLFFNALQIKLRDTIYMKYYKENKDNSIFLSPLFSKKYFKETYVIFKSKLSNHVNVKIQYLNNDNLTECNKESLYLFDFVDYKLSLESFYITTEIKSKKIINISLDNIITDCIIYKQKELV